MSAKEYHKRLWLTMMHARSIFIDLIMELGHVVTKMREFGENADENVKKHLHEFKKIYDDANELFSSFERARTAFEREVL